MFIRPRTRNLFIEIAEKGHDIDYEPILIPEPTAARPGSKEKIQVLRDRLERGEDLYHFGDETIAADWDAQLAMVAFAKSHSKEIRESKRAGNEAARSFQAANATKRRLLEIRRGKS